MSLITFVAVGIYKLFPGDVHVAQASLWFIAIQGCLSYFVAGIAKVISPAWRSGEAVRRILATRTYGSRRSASLVSGRDGVCVALSWLAMLFECTVPLALVFGKTGFAVFAVLGIFFHVTNAVNMGSFGLSSRLIRRFFSAQSASGSDFHIKSLQNLRT